MSDKKDQKNEKVDLAEKLKKAQEEAIQKDQKESTKEEKSSEADKIRTELQEMTELAKRTMADLQNLRRRQEEEKSVWIKMANAELIKALLPIIDNLDRALSHMPDSADDWHQGIEMSINQLNQVMKDFGLEEIECLEKEFNPDLHEAMAQGEGEKNIILEVFEKGYRIGDRIIRHAKVKVGNGDK